MGSQGAQGGLPAPTGLVPLIPNTVHVFELDAPAQKTSQRLLGNWKPATIALGESGKRIST